MSFARATPPPLVGEGSVGPLPDLIINRRLRLPLSHKGEGILSVSALRMGLKFQVSVSIDGVPAPPPWGGGEEFVLPPHSSAYKLNNLRAQFWRTT